MGNKRRPRPKRLAAKLIAIRTQLGLTQAGMAKQMSKTPSPPDGAMISRYERDEREPSLFVIVKYAELIGCSTDYLINDRLDLPAKRCKRVVR